MAWYRNFYHCDDCGTSWWDEWSCSCDDECPACGSSDWSPWWSEDLTLVVEERDGRLVMLRSPDEAEDKPRYQEVNSMSPIQDTRIATPAAPWAARNP